MMMEVRNAKTITYTFIESAKIVTREIFSKICRLRINRQLNATINLYLKMEGVSLDWWDEYVLPTLVGGCSLTGAEQKAPNEPARELYEAVKPKLYYAYDGYADAYLLI